MVCLSYFVVIGKAEPNSSKVFVESTLSKAGFAGDIISHDNVKGSDLRIQDPPKNRKVLDSDDDWDSNVIIVTSPSGLVSSNTRISRNNSSEPEKCSYINFGSEEAV